MDAKAHFLNQYDHFVESLEWADRAIEVSRTVDCTEVLITSLSVSALNHFMLGNLKEAIRLQTEACLVGREAGLLGEALWDGMILADQLALSGDVKQGAAQAEELLREARSLGLSERGAQGGVVLLQTRIRQGRFDESQTLWDELVAMGIDSQYAKWLRAPLLLAQGNGEGAKPYVLSDMEFEAELQGTPNDADIETRTWLFCMLSDWQQAIQIAESFLERARGFRLTAAARVRGLQRLSHDVPREERRRGESGLARASGAPLGTPRPRRAQRELARVVLRGTPPPGRGVRVSTRGQTGDRRPAQRRRPQRAVRSLLRTRTSAHARRRPPGEGGT